MASVWEAFGTTNGAATNCDPVCLFSRTAVAARGPEMRQPTEKYRTPAWSVGWQGCLNAAGTTRRALALMLETPTSGAQHDPTGRSRLQAA